MTIEDKNKILDVVDNILPIKDDDSTKDKELKRQLGDAVKVYSSIMHELAMANKYKGWLNDCSCREYDYITLTFMKEGTETEGDTSVGQIELELLDTARKALEETVKEKEKNAAHWRDVIYKILESDGKDEKTF